MIHRGGRHLAPRLRRISKGWALPLSLAMLLVLTAVAWADTVQNNVVAGGNDTITAGDSTTVTYWIQAEGGDGLPGCNAADGTSATVTLNVPAGVTASTTTLLFTQCNAGSGAKQVTFSSNTPGSYAINVTSIVDSGTGSYTNNANFTLHVQAAPPSNTPPVLVLPADMTVEGNTLGGANVTFSVSASDTEDGDLSGDVQCSPASGSFFTLGGPHTVSCTVEDSGGLTDSGSFEVTVIDTTPPDVTVPADITTTATSNSQAIVNYSGASATDIVWGALTATCTPASGSSFPVGTTTVTCSATDGSGNTGSNTFEVTVTYAWTGFFRPVDNLPTMNVAKAGSAIPVKFSLSGNQGMGIFATGYPRTVPIACDLGYQDTIEETVTAGGSSLSYDSLTDQYNYVWKTDKGWAGTCRQLQVKLIDGQVFTANFKLTK